MRSVCVLASWELESLRENGVKPDCRSHRHASRSEAYEMVGVGDDRNKPYHQPIADFVDAKRIVLKRRFAWRKKMSDGVAVMQLVEV